jgi:hypothetical protein
MKRIPRKLKKKLKMIRIKHFKALLKTKGITLKEWHNMTKSEFLEKVLLTEWHKTRDIMSDNTRPMTEDQKWSGRIW